MAKIARQLNQYFGVVDVVKYQWMEAVFTGYYYTKDITATYIGNCMVEVRTPKVRTIANVKVRFHIVKDGNNFGLPTCHAVTMTAAIKDTSTIVMDTLQYTNTKMKLGKFLGKYHNLPETEIKQLVEYQKAVDAGKATFTVTYMTNAEAIVAIYKKSAYAEGNNYQSCMTDKAAVLVYADNEVLRLAVIYDIDGNFFGRSLVRDDNREYIRIYTANKDDQEAYYAIKGFLYEQGYTSQGDMDDIKLQKIAYNSNEYAMPFIDGNIQNAALYDDYFEITRYGNISCTETCGYITVPCCHDCGTHEYVESYENIFLCNDCVCDYYISEGLVVYHHNECVYLEDLKEYRPRNWDEHVLTDIGYVHADNVVQLEDYDNEKYACPGMQDVTYYDGDDNISEGYYLTEYLAELQQKFADEAGQTDMVEEFV